MRLNKKQVDQILFLAVIVPGIGLGFAMKESSDKWINPSTARVQNNGTIFSALKA